MKKIMIAVLILILASLAIVSADDSTIKILGPYKQNQCVNITQVCGNCTYANISSVTYPDSTTALQGPISMIKFLDEYNYNFCNTSQLNYYIVKGYDDVNGQNTPFAYRFYVTANGNQPPSGIVITFFSALYIVIFLTLVYMVISSLGHAWNLDFDVVDLSWNYGIYFALLTTYVLSNNYFGDSGMIDFTDLILKIAVATNLVFPTIYFIVSIIVGPIARNKLGVRNG